ncbi:glycosyltransferase family 2 protein [Loigolactobacillus backii]|uniref:Bactoprenol glucosyl transferase n=1 Tax=Loigolactobacillus backii TaxID=375175 RepID=A0A192H3Q3_9LACO|nr:glycosyltransferase family 2 protein [Loigolactobacillus backii]ANK60101.1 bactoprenol glucosyl transferase [Loigolactobacillus backii]ANK63449.1 bactoprenol glucosyl transferase [Loigolactobacillus backii]ANK64983.1 bactoprenol glucosyl transferase [Loigolactobacillus backii]ANK66516.1 bactoprenol glucosyl transferase [Loigolactobacillus backii]ANK69547.1 bactoprenol glucosyl transferase [Loigolactobacillus backii]
MPGKLSLIVPCFNEEQTLPLFYPATEKIKTQLRGLSLEYWFINDGSRDSTLDKLKQLQQNDPEHVHYISFSRNFGKESALYAGLQAATGDYVAVMDADLQDPPELLPTMLAGIQDEHYDIVGTKRTDRKGEPPIRSFFSNLFYRLINHISNTPILNGVRDFRLMTRQVVDAILAMKEYRRFSKGIFSWVGFNTKYLPYENHDRIAGKTSWSFGKLFKYSLDGIVAFSELPLSIASFVGFFSFIIAIIALFFIVIRQLVFGDSVAGWASIVSIMIMVGGLQLLCLGIVGKYIGNIYLEVKNRPIYIIKEKK